MKKVIVIVGPTAVGKTKLSLDIAKELNTSIISGDSVSVYKGLDIGSAKPTKEEQALVKHYLIDIREPNDTYSVADFQCEARKIIDENDLSLICGGTGLYIQSALFNYEFEASKRDLDFSKKFEDYSNEELYSLLLSKDPNIDRDKLHPNNRKRVLRALEVLEETNKSIHSFNNKKEAIYDYFIVYLSMPRDILYDRINKRVDLMIDEGLLDEVKGLNDRGIYPHALGYQELVPYFNGLITLDTALDEIKKNTRHLAKRQETWFRNQMDSHFYDASQKYEDLYKCVSNDIKEWLNK